VKNWERCRKLTNVGDVWLFPDRGAAEEHAEAL
jgi:hypothetical protein